MELRLDVSPGELTRAEQKILDYINTNPDTFLFLSIGSWPSAGAVGRHRLPVCPARGLHRLQGPQKPGVEQASGPAVKMAGTLSREDAFSPAAWLERQQLYLEKTARQLDRAEFDRAAAGHH